MVPGSDDERERTLRRTRERVEGLAVPDGEFAVVCRDTGVSPPPVSTARFGAYEDAERARMAAADYREAMRDLDPSLPVYDLAVGEASAVTLRFASVRETTTDRRENGLPRSSRTVTLAGDGRDEWLRIENAPVVHFTGPDALLDDEVVERQLRATLHLP
jgi:hypothetical protein